MGRADMPDRRVTVSSPLLPFIFVIIAGVSVWLAVRLNSTLWVWASIVSSVAAAVSVVIALRQRQAQSAAVFSRAAWVRLVAFAVMGIVLAAAAMGLWLAHGRAYALVHPGRGAIVHTPESLGIAGLEAVSFQFKLPSPIISTAATARLGPTLLLNRRRFGRLRHGRV